VFEVQISVINENLPRVLIFVDNELLKTSKAFEKLISRTVFIIIRLNTGILLLFKLVNIKKLINLTGN
jgi:hypothetical protein